MSAVISDKVMMKEVLKATGFDCPQGMENKTFEQATSGGGGGGSGITVEPITITQNGTTAAPDGKAYSPVTVNVPLSAASVTMENVQSGKLTTAGTPVTLSYVYGKGSDANYVVWIGREQINTRDLAVGQTYNYTTSSSGLTFDITLKKETASGEGYKVTAEFKDRGEVYAPLNCFLVVGTLN